MATKIHDLTTNFENLTVENLPKSDFGALHLDFQTTMDTPLLHIIGEQGKIFLEVKAGRIDGEIVGADPHSERRLDAEDTIGADDGFIHSLTVAVTSSGTHLVLTVENVGSTPSDSGFPRGWAIWGVGD